MVGQFDLNASDWSFFTAPAATDLSAKQFRIVTLATDSTIDLCDASKTPLGVLQNKPTAGKTAIVRVRGVSKVRVSSAGLAATAQYGSDAVGRAVAISGDKGIILGTCIVAGGAVEDDIASVTVVGGIKHTLSV